MTKFSLIPGQGRWLFSVGASDTFDLRRTPAVGSCQQAHPRDSRSYWFTLFAENEVQCISLPVASLELPEFSKQSLFLEAPGGKYVREGWVGASQTTKNRWQLSTMCFG